VSSGPDGFVAAARQYPTVASIAVLQTRQYRLLADRGQRHVVDINLPKIRHALDGDR
jgi:hypothetical protein